MAVFTGRLVKAFKRFEQMTAEQLGKDEIFIKKNATLVKLKYDDILWVEALENYVIFNTFTEKYTIHFTMKAIEQKLPGAKFTTGAQVLHCEYQLHQCN